MQKALISVVDFGLVVLIWLVQLIIYPSFDKIDKSVFVQWHTDYTKWITVVVAPLMFAQLFLIIWQLTATQNVLLWVKLALIASVWILTFLYAVPLHNQLGAEGNSSLLVQKLVAVNWPRTIIWTAIFMIGLLHFR